MTDSPLQAIIERDERKRINLPGRILPGLVAAALVGSASAGCWSRAPLGRGPTARPGRSALNHRGRVQALH